MDELGRERGRRLEPRAAITELYFFQSVVIFFAFGDRWGIFVTMRGCKGGEGGV